MYVFVNDDGILEIYAEEKDICYACGNMNICPLLASLQNELVLLRCDGFCVEECGMFEDIPAEELIRDLSG